MPENATQYAVESTETGEQPQAAPNSALRFKTLRELALALLEEVESLKEAQALDGKQTVNLLEEVRRFEADLIRWALVRTGGHQRRAARLLNIKVTTLNAKIKRYGIRPATSIPANNVVDLYPEGRRDGTQ